MFFPLINLITHCAVSKISVVGTDFYLLYVQNVTVLSQHNKLINPPPKKNKRTNKQTKTNKTQQIVYKDVHDLSFLYRKCKVYTPWSLLV